MLKPQFQMLLHAAHSTYITKHHSHMLLYLSPLVLFQHVCSYFHIKREFYFFSLLVLYLLLLSFFQSLTCQTFKRSQRSSPCCHTRLTFPFTDLELIIKLRLVPLLLLLTFTSFANFHLSFVITCGDDVNLLLSALAVFAAH